MNASTSLHKLTVFSQLLGELQSRTEEMQIQKIKAAGEDDLRLMLLSRYPLKVVKMPDTMASLIREIQNILPDINKIIEN